MSLAGGSLAAQDSVPCRRKTLVPGALALCVRGLWVRGLWVRGLSVLALGSVAIIVAISVGCATKPTVVSETIQRQFLGGPALLKPIQLTESIVVVDARSSFDYSMARVPRSVHINWADYAEAEPNLRGWPQRDLFAAARRIARLGIEPSTPVVVLGQGKNGQGEEGRVAWLLAYLGVRDVRFAKFDAVRKRITTEALPPSRETPEDRMLDEGESSFATSSKAPAESPPKAAPIWKPLIVSSLIVREPEFKKALLADSRMKIIDVRPAKEYLGTQGGLRAKMIPNIEALNVPWKEFFTDDFRPDPEIAPKLQSVNVTPDLRIVVIDNDGIAAAAVAMALRALGFEQAGVYAGGYNDLLSR